MPLFDANFIKELPVILPAILVALTFHEYAHAKTAALLGDPTPAREGRLTLNPLAHLDPLGTLLLIVARFGWAKPVHFNPFYFKGDRRRGVLLVSVAGPLMNLALAYLAAFAVMALRPSGYAYLLFDRLIIYNVVLAVFNLIPVPPLDGSKILAGLLPRQAGEFIYRLESYGSLALLLLVFTGAIGYVLGPPVAALYTLLYRVAGVSFF